MKFSINAFLGLGLAASAIASPLEVLETRQGVQVAHLTFHGGPASYSLDVPADGREVPTNNDISVSIIDAPDYNALAQCTFHTAGNAPVALVGNVSPEGVQQILVGPPTPITSVSCEGPCIPINGICFQNGILYGSCCNGFCAGSRCRAWNSTGNA